MKKDVTIIGLTGGISMGKSTAAKILRDFGLPIYQADRAVHALLRKGGGAVKPVARLFPGILKRGAVDRGKLGQLVFGRPAKLKKLEKILHPLVRDAERAFLKNARRKKAKAVVLEIPLLFETGGQKRCDFTICVSAPPAVQKTRAMKRRGMTAEKLRAILKRQMSDGQKRKLADYVVDTGRGTGKTRRELAAILRRHNVT